MLYTSMCFVLCFCLFLLQRHHPLSNSLSKPKTDSANQIPPKSKKKKRSTYKLSVDDGGGSGSDPNVITQANKLDVQHRALSDSTDHNGRPVVKVSIQSRLRSVLFLHDDQGCRSGGGHLGSTERLGEARVGRHGLRDGFWARSRSVLEGN